MQRSKYFITPLRLRALERDSNLHLNNEGYDFCAPCGLKKIKLEDSSQMPIRKKKTNLYFQHLQSGEFVRIKFYEVLRY